MMISKKILVPAGFKQVIEVLQKRIPDLISVYCFGSSVQDCETLGSDLDIAYLSDRQITNIKRWMIQEEIASLLILLIRDEETVKFLEMTDRRNNTAHTYKEEVAQIIYSKIPVYFLLMESLLERVMNKI